MSVMERRLARLEGAQGAARLLVYSGPNDASSEAVSRLLHEAAGPVSERDMIIHVRRFNPAAPLRFISSHRLP